MSNPQYQHASYAGESVTIKNNKIRIDVHKRLTGWGWAEIYTSSGKYLGVLDHFGELMLRDQEMPMRLEADNYERETGDFGERLTFNVKAMIVQQKLKGTSFEQWIHYPINEHCMEGKVILTLVPDEAVVQLSFDLKSKGNLFARYVRGPWFKAGADGFGSHKEDAIFPGVEWVIDDEWSSGTDWFKDPWAKRYVPHLNKVAIPIMTVSYDGDAVGMAWNPKSDATRWFNYQVHNQQPVFASPNFLDRANNHLLGLMVPQVMSETEENEIYADTPLELHPDQSIQFEAEIFAAKGNSLDAITDWVRRHGLPEVPEPRWPLSEALERIASAYNSRFWVEEKGFGIAQNPNSIGPNEPRFLEQFLELSSGQPLAVELEKKIDWCRKQSNYSKNLSRFGKVASIPLMSRDKQMEYGETLLSYQKEDGSFTFEPEGRHYVKDDFVVAREYLEPMGLAGDTALDICILPAADLIALWKETGERTFRDAALKALEFCIEMRRPEGGDFWETPLHSPNLLAAGNAALTYYLAYQAFGDERYKDKAVYWLRSLLPFTHLWHPEDVQMMYNTKPCFCSSDWYFANWVRDHVQWEVLETFATATQLGLDWNELDPEIDWHQYQEGITVASLRWMVDHRDNNWRPHNLPWTEHLYNQGLLDDCYADTHNSVTGNYGGMVIPPDPIAVNLIAVIKRKLTKV